MPANSNSVLGVVELVHGAAEDYRNKCTSQVLHDAFGHRLNGWVRTHDEWSFLNDNRACVILRDIDNTRELEQAAADLDKVFSEPHYHLGRALPLTVTAGFTQFNDKDSDLALALQEAGIALDQAKQSDNLFKVFSPHTAKTEQEELELLEQMQRALKQGEFHLYYQPKIHAGSRKLIGAEALIRWRHSKHGIIAPDQFIDLAKRHDLIKPVTKWVIKSAVQRLARWPEQLSIAVNLCPSLLLDSDIASVISDALVSFAVTPSRLNLEMTERFMSDDQERMLEQLARLQAIGVRISIDEFGTGISSLACCRDLPVDEVKIDQRFVRNMLVSEKDHATVKALVDLAHNFSLQVVAVGVESIAIADRLAEMRCDMLQGYVFDKPLPVEEFELEYRI
jgi:EAL domain-containing protein (putative c-di-GMP-specific phosphodiesterase class I)